MWSWSAPFAPTVASTANRINRRVRKSRWSRCRKLHACSARSENPSVVSCAAAETWRIARPSLVTGGYLLARPRAGTRVSEGMATVNRGGGEVTGRPPPIRYEMRSGAPDPAAFPRRAWQSATVHGLRGLPDADFLGPHRGGLAQLRIAPADPERVVISSGLAPGLAVLLEDQRCASDGWSYPPTSRTISSTAAKPAAPGHRSSNKPPSRR
jgi:hypothetical protein